MKANSHNPSDYIPSRAKDNLPGIETNLFDNPRLVKPIGDDNPQMHQEAYKVQKYQKEAPEYQTKHKYINNKIKEEERKEKLKKEEFKRNQTKIPLSEKQVKELMKTDAYTNKYSPNYEKTQNQVRVAYENLYPDDDRNEHPENYYIWRTVGDGKTRSSHADRDEEVFCWKQSTKRRSS